jgi:hypothetical protein
MLVWVRFISSSKAVPTQSLASFGSQPSLRSVEPSSFDYFSDLCRPYSAVFSGWLSKRKQK